MRWFSVKLTHFPQDQIPVKRSTLPKTTRDRLIAPNFLLESHPHSSPKHSNPSPAVGGRRQLLTNNNS
ncbi:hypothetical protein TNCV_1844731 [Trichonephila clavipes]|nr:hypothetical protein TNCV_1844731 [Trichonephila clavipes]